MPGLHGAVETASDARAGAHAPAREGEMPGAQRPGVSSADTEPVGGGALSPVFVPDPARQHGELLRGDGDLEHTSARPGRVDDEAVSVQRFFQQELAAFGHDLTVRRGTVRHEGAPRAVGAERVLFAGLPPQRAAGVRTGSA